MLIEQKAEKSLANIGWNNETTTWASTYLKVQIGATSVQIELLTVELYLRQVKVTETSGSLIRISGWEFGTQREVDSVRNIKRTIWVRVLPKVIQKVFQKQH
jgi:hypothetical protein